MQSEKQGGLAKGSGPGMRPVRQRLDAGLLNARPSLHLLVAYRASGVWSGFTRLMEDECERSEPLIWLVVVLGLGILTYFVAPIEPSFAASVMVFAGLGGLTLRLRHHSYYVYVFLGLSFFFAGFTLPAVHTHMFAAPQIEREKTVRLMATILKKEQREHGSSRLLLGKIETSDRRFNNLKTVRVRVLSKDFDGLPGDRISLLARLRPGGGPVMPGQFDFARQAFFKGISATGFSYGVPEIVSRGHAFQVAAGIERLRGRIADRLSHTFKPYDENVNAVGAALLVGEKGMLPRETRDSFALSGLAHLLAISGLHMALVVTGVIFLTRGALALIPGVAIHYPVRQIAGVLGLATGLIYFLMSGGSTSATRAFVMIAIMVLALIAGRRALSIRNVALAALVILFLNPNEILMPGFQMSFAATLALVCFVPPMLSRFERRPHDLSVMHTIVRGVLIFFAGVAVTSLIAGFASGLFAAFHFHRIAPYGLLANLASVPVFTFIVMPFGFLGMVAMPFGFETYPLQVMALGIQYVLFISDYFARATGEMGAVGRLDLHVFGILCLCMVVFCLLKGFLRMAPLLCGVLMFFFLIETERPDLLISEDGKTVALRATQSDGSDTLVVSGARSGRFELQNWSRALGIEGYSSNRQKGEVTNPRCDAMGCLFRTDKGLVAHVKEIDAFLEDCARASVVISALSAPRFCHDQTTVIDYFTLREGGAQAVYFDRRASFSDTIRVVPAISDRKRPWHQHYWEQSR